MLAVPPAAESSQLFESTHHDFFEHSVIGVKLPFGYGSGITTFLISVTGLPLGDVARTFNATGITCKFARPLKSTKCVSCLRTF